MISRSPLYFISVSNKWWGPWRRKQADNAGIALALMRQSTDGYQPPEWACDTYRAMLEGLRQLESDLHQHIHKENNVLFPKAIRLESERRASAGD